MSSTSKGSSITRPIVLDTEVEELRNDTTKKFAASDSALKELKEVIALMKTHHNEQLSKIKELLSEPDTQISNKLIKRAVLEVVPDVITKEMETQVPCIVKEALAQLSPQLAAGSQNMYNNMNDLNHQSKYILINN
eukprot:7422266-Ditylum_brightwellii.AAC.1